MDEEGRIFGILFMRAPQIPPFFFFSNSSGEVLPGWERGLRIKSLSPAILYTGEVP